jgi:hypothetical protein
MVAKVKYPYTSGPADRKKVETTLSKVAIFKSL